MENSKSKMQNPKLAKPKILFLGVFLVFILGLFSAFQVKSQQDLPKEISEEMEKREIFKCKKIPYGEFLRDTEKHLDKFLPRLIDLKDKTKLLFPGGLKIIDLAGECKCEYCEGVCKCKEMACVRVKVCMKYPGCTNTSFMPAEVEAPCEDGTRVKVKVKLCGYCTDPNADYTLLCTDTPPCGLFGGGRVKVPRCGTCCCKNGYKLIDTEIQGDYKVKIFYPSCVVAPTPPPDQQECQNTDDCIHDPNFGPGYVCVNHQCLFGPPGNPGNPWPYATPPPNGDGGPGNFSPCKPRPCQGNPCLIDKLGTELVGKEKEKEKFKEALEKLKLLERELIQLHNASLRLEYAFGLWYRERQKTSLFDCYEFKDMNLPEGPSECPFNGNTYFHCK